MPHITIFICQKIETFMTSNLIHQDLVDVRVELVSVCGHRDGPLSNYPDHGTGPDLELNVLDPVPVLDDGLSQLVPVFFDLVLGFLLGLFHLSAASRQNRAKF